MKLSYTTNSFFLSITCTIEFNFPNLNSFRQIRVVSGCNANSDEHDSNICALPCHFHGHAEFPDSSFHQVWVIKSLILHGLSLIGLFLMPFHFDSVFLRKMNSDFKVNFFLRNLLVELPEFLSFELIVSRVTFFNCTRLSKKIRGWRTGRGRKSHHTRTTSDEETQGLLVGYAN
jgi:hypothetical protein